MAVATKVFGEAVGDIVTIQATMLTWNDKKRCEIFDVNEKNLL